LWEAPRPLGHFIPFLVRSLGGDHWKDRFERVLLEAMAGALPVLRLRSGGIPDMIGADGLLVHEVERRGRSGRARVERHFSVEVRAARIRDLLGARPQERAARRT
jgi:glycosyltransferase involved in cell wall biosynthesis